MAAVKHYTRSLAVLAMVCGMSLGSATVGQTIGSEPVSNRTEATLRAARSCNDGLNTPRDYKKAFLLFSEASGEGSPEAKAWLGLLYLRGHGTSADVSKALALITEAANDKNPVGIRFLGYLYQVGAGVTRDSGKAQELYREAMALKDGNSFGRLGLMYLKGVDMPADLAAALKLIRQGADLGDVWSTAEMGLLYEMGSHGAASGPLMPDYGQAFHYYGIASDQGDAFASYRLGRMYESGEGVPLSVTTAASYYEKATWRGLASAQVALGELYESGNGGIPRDPSRAYAYYTIASRQGDELGEEHLRHLVTTLTAQEKLSGDAMMRDFLTPNSY